MGRQLERRENMKMRTEKGYLACETDILVVGSEGAGARAAIEAFDKGTRVIIATKGKIGKTGATCIAGADFTVDGKSAKEYCGLAGDERDSPERYFSGKYSSMLRSKRMSNFLVEKSSANGIFGLWNQFRSLRQKKL